MFSKEYFFKKAEELSKEIGEVFYVKFFQYQGKFDIDIKNDRNIGDEEVVASFYAGELVVQ